MLTFTKFTHSANAAETHQIGESYRARRVTRHVAEWATLHFGRIVGSLQEFSSCGLARIVGGLLGFVGCRECHCNFYFIFHNPLLSLSLQCFSWSTNIIGFSVGTRWFECGWWGWSFTSYLLLALRKRAGLFHSFESPPPAPHSLP